jgi:proline iminopeptidase
MKRVFIFLGTFLMFVSCSQTHNSSISTTDYFDYSDTGVKTAGVKMIPIKTDIGTFKVWTKRVGNNPLIKVLLLHGGPSATHEYMEAFESFFPQEGFEFYEYDQLGSYYSDQPTDSSLWTIDRFVDEVEQVRIALGLNKNNFFLYGNSWGGILAMEYALKHQQNLKGLIISNMMSDISDYANYQKKLHSQMPQLIVDSIKNYEEKGMFDNANYQRLLATEFYNKHICRLPEWPDAVTRTFKHLNYQVYLLMQGPSEFSVGGRLKNWSRKTELHKITVPTLTIGATFDTMDPEHMKWMSTQVKNGQFLLCPNGSHMSMWDDQKHFFPGLIQFINKVNAEE